MQALHKQNVAYYTKFMREIHGQEYDDDIITPPPPEKEDEVVQHSLRFCPSGLSLSHANKYTTWTQRTTTGEGEEGETESETQGKTGEGR
jgi:hypothetical protein